MKKGILFFGKCFALLLYCVAIGIVSGHSENSISNPTHFGKENISAKTAIHLYGLSEQTHSTVSAYKEITFPSIKNLISGSVGIAKSTFTVFYISFSQCTSFLRHFPISFGKVDIIFPFHYFW